MDQTRGTLVLSTWRGWSESGGRRGQESQRIGDALIFPHVHPDQGFGFGARANGNKPIRNPARGEPCGCAQVRRHPDPTRCARRLRRESRVSSQGDGRAKFPRLQNPICIDPHLSIMNVESLYVAPLSDPQSLREALPEGPVLAGPSRIYGCCLARFLFAGGHGRR